jgi:hypothetical protein
MLLCSPDIRTRDQDYPATGSCSPVNKLCGDGHNCEIRRIGGREWPRSTSRLGWLNKRYNPSHPFWIPHRKHHGLRMRTFHLCVHNICATNARNLASVPCRYRVWDMEECPLVYAANRGGRHPAVGSCILVPSYPTAVRDPQNLLGPDLMSASSRVTAKSQEVGPAKIMVRCSDELPGRNKR